MNQVGCNIHAISGIYYTFFAINGKFEFAGSTIGCLSMKMLVRRTNRSFFEFHFYHHYLVVGSLNLTRYSAT